MTLTPHQAQYFAYELTRQRSGRDRDKLTSALLDAQVELTPHQVAAALFAFRSPLSRGVILADEVGLGKTIEAGLVIAQKWAERKRKILVIVPANLRKQWSQELMDKFFLPSIILEAKTAKEQNSNPFEQTDQVVICSYHFARAQQDRIGAVDWSLVVLDEAHKLRNVYRSDNKIGRAIRDAILDKPKILLTATPLQNSLLELYGLSSLIDPYIFGDLKSFKLQFARLSGNDVRYEDLRQRIAPVYQRTLRRDVLQYVRYTKREALTEDFFPGDDEWQLYEWVSDYLQNDKLYALPASQRQLMTLILRRLLASSTFAIRGTFDVLADKLKAILELHRREGIVPTDEQVAQLDAQQEQAIAENFEDYEDLKEEWAEADEDAAAAPIFQPRELDEIKREKELLEKFAAHAAKIQVNQKGEHLLAALEKGFARLHELGAPEKVIIFTESTRTQRYIHEHLQSIEQFKDRIVLFNGTNGDPLSNKIYREWHEANKGTDRVTGSPTADKRAALVERFARADTKVMIATEAGAEGINLQFCSFIVNYDLPWNPQRIEQRIGRCHRYGQKHDVVVLNFINKRNAADERVYKLLEEKFKLFEGVFGASDEVLGDIESGVGFERRVLEIFQNCRKDDAINLAFDELRKELEETISAETHRTRRELLENLDAEVVGKVKMSELASTGDSLDKYHDWLWKVTRYALRQQADFQEESKSFRLKSNPFPPLHIQTGAYQMLPRPASANPANQTAGLLNWFQNLHQKPASTYRAGHPLALAVLDRCKQEMLPVAQLQFLYSGYPHVAILQGHIGQSGWLRMELLELGYAEEKEAQLLFAAVTDSGQTLDADQCRALFQHLETRSIADRIAPPPAEVADALYLLLTQEETEEMRSNEDWLKQFFDREQSKLERWADDRRASLRAELKDLETSIKQQKAEARKMLQLQAKVDAQRSIKGLESKLAERKFNQFETEKDIEIKKDKFLDDIENRIRQSPQRKHLFTIRWTIVQTPPTDLT